MLDTKIKEKLVHKFDFSGFINNSDLNEKNEKTLAKKTKLKEEYKKI